MVEEREVVVADAGMEDLFDYVSEKIANVESEKAEAYEVAKAEIDAKYENRLAKFNETLAGISHKEIIEVEVEEEVDAETEGETPVEA